MANRQGKLYIGTSGYQYAHWQGRFYPRDWPKRRWFEYYTSRFETVEINNTFYRLPEAGAFQRWRDEAPPGFQYALKFSRYGSHIKRLKDPRDTVANFIGRACHLGPCLGPILVQLPPNWKANPERLEAFLASLPADYRWTLEFRDPSWLREEIFELLASYRAGLCVHDLLADHPRRPTADWMYLRYHGDHYTGSYHHQFLTAEAKRIRGELDRGLDVHAYFNNDRDGHAPANGLDLRRYVEHRAG